MLNFVAEPGQVVDLIVPLRNAGAIPFDVSIEPSHYAELFTVMPTMCMIEPGGQSDVHVRFAVPENVNSAVYER
jgi:hypothetical protein